MYGNRPPQHRPHRSMGASPTPGHQSPRPFSPRSRGSHDQEIIKVAAADSKLENNATTITATTTTQIAAANRDREPQDDVGSQIAGSSFDTAATVDSRPPSSTGFARSRIPLPIAISEGGTESSISFSENNDPNATPVALYPEKSSISHENDLEAHAPPPPAALPRTESRSRSSTSLSSPSMSLHHILGIHSSPDSPLRRQFASPAASPAGLNKRHGSFMTLASSSSAASASARPYSYDTPKRSRSPLVEGSGQLDGEADDAEAGSHGMEEEGDDGIDEEDSDDEDVRHIRTRDLDTAIETIRIIRREYVVFRLEDMASKLRTPLNNPNYVGLDYDDLVVLEDHLNSMHRILKGRNSSSAAPAGPFPVGHDPTRLLESVVNRGGGRADSHKRRSAPAGPVGVIGSPPPPLSRRSVTPQADVDEEDDGHGLATPGPSASTADQYASTIATTPEPWSWPDQPKEDDPTEPCLPEDAAPPLSEATGPPTGAPPADPTASVSASSSQVSTEVADLLVKEAEKLCQELSTVARNLNDRREESDHIWQILVEGRERDADRVVELQGRVEEIENLVQETDSELSHLRLQMRAVELQCADHVPPDADPELQESIRNFKSDFEAVRRKWQARRERAGSLRGDSMSLSRMASSMATTTPGTTTAPTTPARRRSPGLSGRPYT